MYSSPSDLCLDLGLHLGSETRSVIRTGAVLRCECIAVYLLGSEIGRLYNVELGSCVRAALGTSLLILSGCFVRNSVRRCSAENAADQRPAEADLAALGGGVYVSCCSHFSVPGIIVALFMAYASLSNS